MKQRVLITGGLGFVGLQLALWMPPEYDIVITDIRDPHKEEEQLLSLRIAETVFRRLDVMDHQAVLEILSTERITHVIHGAAVTSGYENDAVLKARAARLNVGGTLNVLEACQKQPSVESLLFLSSSGIYIGNVPENGCTQAEDGNFPLDSLYAATKRASEIVLEQCVSEKGVRAASLRLGSVYGPLEMPTSTRQNLSQIGRLARAIHEGRKLRVYGKQISRDWISGTDLAAAVYKLLKAGQWNHAVYNLGTGISTAFEEIVDCFRQHGLQAEWTDSEACTDLAMTSGSWRAALDISRLKDDTGFVPQVSISEGIAKLLEIEQKVMK